MLSCSRSWTQHAPEHALQLPQFSEAMLTAGKATQLGLPCKIEAGIWRQERHGFALMPNAKLQVASESRNNSAGHLEDEGVGEAGDGEDALHAVQVLPPHLDQAAQPVVHLRRRAHVDFKSGHARSSPYHATAPCFAVFAVGPAASLFGHLLDFQASGRLEENAKCCGKITSPTFQQPHTKTHTLLFPPKCAGDGSP